MGFVITIYKSVSKGKIMCLEEAANLIEGFGLEGDRHGGKGDRQVSILGMESIRKIEETGEKGLCTDRFNANIITEEIRLFESPVGTCLKMGETIQEITQVGKACFGCEMEGGKEACTLVGEVVFTSVIEGGVIKPGDFIEVL